MTVRELPAHTPRQLRRELERIPPAVLSKNTRHRYLLTRHTGANMRLSRLVNFIVLNPSTADAVDDDSTIRRCRKFAQSWGFDMMAVTNLWSYRTKNPGELFAALPFSPQIDSRNLAVVKLVARTANLTVVAYGNKGGRDQRDEHILDILEEVRVDPKALRVTAAGFPGHPLYVPANTEPRSYRKARKTRRPKKASQPNYSGRHGT